MLIEFEGGGVEKGCFVDGVVQNVSEWCSYFAGYEDNKVEEYHILDTPISQFVTRPEKYVDQ